MIPSEQPARTIAEILVGLAMWAGIAWPVIFVTALRNRRPDRPPSQFFGHLRDYRPKQPPEVWWHHVIRLPLYCGFILFVAFQFPLSPTDVSGWFMGQIEGETGR